MFQVRRGSEIEVVLLNGTRLGSVGRRKELEQWLENVRFLGKSKKVCVKSHHHLNVFNGSRPDGCLFQEVGGGIYKVTHSSFAIVVFRDAAKRRKLALVPQQNVSELR
mgnify:CR=1 FL=1